jgi:hypothetical protein
MRNNAVINMPSRLSRQAPSPTTYCRIVVRLISLLNLTQKLHNLTQKFIVLVSYMIYISLRFRRACKCACAILIEPHELEKKSRLLTLLE